MKETMVLIPVVILMLVGLAITLRSSVVHGPGQRVGVSDLMSTLSALFVRVVGYLVGIVAIQHVIGFPRVMGW